MEDQYDTKWIICRICLKTSDKEMSPIFGTEAIKTCLAEQIAEYGSIILNGSKTCPNRICDKCLLLLNAAKKFRKLCQRSAKQWQDLMELNEREPIVKNDKSNTLIEVVNKTDYSVQLNETARPEKSLVLHEEQQKDEGDTIDSYVFEVIEDVGEYCEEGDDRILESNVGEFVDLENDRIDFLEDNSTGNSEELSYYSNSQFEVLKHEETLSSDGTLNKLFYHESNLEKSKKELEKTTEHSEGELGVSTKRVSLKTHVTRSCKKITDLKKSLQKTKSKDVGDSPKVWPKTSANNYICSYCGNVYSEKAKLTLHLRIHTKEKPHECEICHKRFAQTPQLTRHMNSHTGNRPFKCKFCEASFADPSTCIKHQRIHTQERPYVCETCGKAFSYSNVLKVHVMSHTGEKPYNCKYCGKKFSQSHHRRTHERIHT